MHESLPASLVDRHVDADLREMNRPLDPVLEGVANVDGRTCGKRINASPQGIE
jgi:hypothetical protein